LADLAINTWARLLKISAVLLPLAVLLALCGQIIQLYIDTLPFPSLSGAGSGYVDSDIASSFTYLLLTLWGLSLAPKMLRLERAGPTPGEV